MTMAYWNRTVRPTRQSQNKRQRFVENQRFMSKGKTDAAMNLGNKELF